MVLTPFTTAALAASHPVLRPSGEGERMRKSRRSGVVRCLLDRHFLLAFLCVFECMRVEKMREGEREGGGLGLAGIEERGTRAMRKFRRLINGWGLSGKKRE